MLKVAVIGCGNMGQHHAKAYTVLDQVQFVAACDSNIERFEAITKEESTTYYSTVDEMLENEPIDAVSICVPTSQHYNVAKVCIDRGIAVLVEKPIAESVKEAKALVQYAKEKQVVLTVGHIERFNPAILKAKEYINDGKLGQIHAIQCKRYGPFPKQIKDADVLVDVAVHDIDIVQFLVDSNLVSTDVYTHNIHCDDRADYGHLMLQFESKLMVNIHVSWALPFKHREVEIVGDKGIAIIDCIQQSMTYYEVDVEKGPDFVSLPLTDPQAVTIDKKEPIIEECRAFSNAVINNTAPFICPEQATEALSLALCTPVN
ncbi:hypothetical protein DID73_01795 [Candidatus Marinamargulisbacteria bacterium SCGC AG-343-K17]|nr:hypothetical protein DID73_01795 [Candidatus Marinamargulisbacteria bacterium SCGC AG-343-K17]